MPILVLNMKVLISFSIFVGRGIKHNQNGKEGFTFVVFLYGTNLFNKLVKVELIKETIQKEKNNSNGVISWNPVHKSWYNNKDNKKCQKCMNESLECKLGIFKLIQQNSIILFLTLRFFS